MNGTSVNMAGTTLTKRFALGVVVAALSVGMSAGVSHALPLAGEIWQGIPDAANANDPANQTGNHALFTPGPINYSSPPSAYTPNGFLGSPTFTSQTGTFDPNGDLNNTLIEITGTIGLLAGNNALELGHDDGAILNIAGITGAANPACTGANAGAVLCVPGSSVFDLTPFNVTAPSTGNYDFTLWYTECCTAPAVLEFVVNDVEVGQVPEPASLALLGTGLIALGLLRRRQRKAA